MNFARSFIEILDLSKMKRRIYINFYLRILDKFHKNLLKLENSFFLLLFFNFEVYMPNLKYM